MIQKLITNLKENNYWPHFFSAPERPPSPREQFGQIFDIIQLSHTFSDSKTFVDAVPKQRLSRIKRDYHKQYGAQLDINRFVRNHFTLPPVIIEPEITYDHETSTTHIRTYIEEMWSTLTRDADKTERNSSLLHLPYRYVVPGGRFREIYYWDSYFTMLGLRESGKNDLIEDMVKNFAHLIHQYGCIPNGNRTYYLTRSQPPVFALMVELLAEIKGEQVLDEYALSMYQEYKYWMRGSTASKFADNKVNASEHVVRMPNGTLLNRYWDESISPREESFREDVELGRTLDESSVFYRNMRAGAESGWDYSTRWFAEGGDLSTIRVTDIVPIDLNVFLYRTEEILARTYQRQGKTKLAVKYSQLAQARRETLQEYFWDDESGWFSDYLHTEQRISPKHTIAGSYALWGGIATPEQAPRITDMIEQQYLRPGGVVTTLENSGQQWDAPNGWAPMQYITVMGLDRYGAHQLAEEITGRWCNLNLSFFTKTGLLFEKYNVEDTSVLASGGEYKLQHGFGWTNGILLALMNKYHLNKDFTESKLKD